MIPFFLALFPQFTRPEIGQVAIQSLPPGGMLAGMALFWIRGLVRKRSLDRTTSQAAALKFHGKSSSILFWGCPLAIAVRVALR